MTSRGSTTTSGLLSPSIRLRMALSVSAVMTTLCPVAFVKAGASRFCTAAGAPDENTWMSAAVAGAAASSTTRIQTGDGDAHSHAARWRSQRSSSHVAQS